jgi:acetoin utilization deacetylase AcuC-like enzyme
MTGLIADPISKEHITGPGHPERPERFDAALAALNGMDLMRVPARLAIDDEIALCHARKYIRTVEHEVMTGFHDLSTGDTTISSRSLDAALYAAGAALNAVDAVVERRVQNAFCIARPPGHHATPNRGMGFCIFNNVAIAARYAQRKHGVDRVLIADWDVHHGNGTQDTFYTDGSVFFCSTHQSPWYPGTGPEEEIGQDAGEGWIMNRPFPAGAGREEILGVFQEMLMPAAERIKPELIIISAGFDSRIDDPLGHFRLTDADFKDLTNVMLEIADKHAHGRLVSVLEGGYSLDGLACGVRAHVEALRASS